MHAAEALSGRGLGSSACGCVEENPHIETERQNLHAAYPASISACRTSCKDRLQRNGASTPQRNVSALSGMTHFTKRVRWWWAGLGFGAWSGKVHGGCHGSFRPEDAGRSALRAARVASEVSSRTPCQGPKMWASRVCPEYGRAVGLPWKALCPGRDARFLGLDLRTTLFG